MFYAVRLRHSYNSVSGKRARPAALGFDHLVNLGHEAGRLIQSDDDLLVVLNVFVGQGAAFAVLEPFRNSCWRAQAIPLSGVGVRGRGSTIFRARLTERNLLSPLRSIKRFFYSL